MAEWISKTGLWIAIGALLGAADWYPWSSWQWWAWLMVIILLVEARDRALRSNAELTRRAEGTSGAAKRSES